MVIILVGFYSKNIYLITDYFIKVILKQPFNFNMEFIY